MRVKQEEAKTNKKAMSLDYKERTKELEVKDKLRTDAVVAVKEAWRKDIDTSKEIRVLRK